MQVQLEVGALLERGHQLLGPDAMVHVGAQWHVGGGDLLARVAAFDHQRGPLLDLCLVFRVLHAVEQRVLDQGLLALLEEGDVVITPDEAHMRRGVHESLGRLQVAAADLVGPELTRHLELLGNANGTLGFHAAVGQLGRVVEFGKAGVAGAGVVPAVGAFQGHAVQAFEDLDLPVRLQLLQVGGQRGAHHAGTDHHHIDGLFVLGLGDGAGNSGQNKNNSAARTRAATAQSCFDRLFMTFLDLTTKSLQAGGRLCEDTGQVL